jgi:nucleotide-binding universal stress UspA family protein
VSVVADSLSDERFNEPAICSSLREKVATMFTRIFVPLDGSRRAEQALPVAARIARNTAGTLVLVRVVNIAPDLNPYFVLPPAGPPGLTLQALDAAKDYLTQIARSDVLAGIDPVTVVLTGLAPHELLDESEAQKADLVVMSSHGRTGLSRWVLGSVAQRVARHAKVPVLILRENLPLVGEREMADRTVRVLIPLDGSPRAEAIIPGLGGLLEDLQLSGRTEVRLVSVIDPFELAVAQLEENIALEGANAYLKRVAGRLNAEYPKARIQVTWSVVANSDVASVLIAMAESSAGIAQTGVPASYDLVAMATHGRTGLSRWALGSITERVFNSITVPLLILRPPDIVQQQLPDDIREHVAMPVPF